MRLLEQTGEVGRACVEVYSLLAANPFLEALPSWELLFEMAGITDPALKRHVYEQVCQWIKIEQEHKKADDPEEREKRTIHNPAA